MGNFLGRRKHRRHIHSHSFSRKGLQFFAEDYRIRAAGLDELHLLRRECRRNIDQLFIAEAELLFFGVNGQHRAGVH